MTFNAQGSPSLPPIRHLLVYANPAADSFDHAIVERYVAETSRRGQETIVRDLYAMAFDPVLKAEERPLHGGGWTPTPEIATELELIASADILVLVYPIWFGLPPAILKGYVDRVLGAGYSFRDMHDQSGQAALEGKPLLSFSTSGTSDAWLSEHGQPMSLRTIFDVYLWRGFCMKQSEHITIDSVVPNISTAYAAEQLERVRSTAERTCSTLASDRHAGYTARVMARRKQGSAG
ncbi:NAD(P)H-dependent oxidoreductase [Sphingomonas sp. NPDC079357]|uniref:NAD(P)H-dependent oxidoreductase n=1 Tax=Sphingomonas sp. NPDC079357 TaxID=3364518 RepID=UPI00384E3084